MEKPGEKSAPEGAIYFKRSFQKKGEASVVCHPADPDGAAAQMERICERMRSVLRRIR